MTNWVDIAIIAIIAFFALIGLWKSFAKTTLKLVFFAISLVCTYFVGDYVLNWLFGIPFLNNLLLAMGGMYQGWIGDAAEIGGVVGSFVNPIIESLGGAAKYGLTTGQLAGIILGYNAFKVIVYVFVYAVLRCVIAIVGWIVGKILVHGTPKAFGRLLGFVMGAARGAAYVAALLVVSNALYPIPLLSAYSATTTDSMIGSWAAPVVNGMYDNLLYGEGEIKLIVDRFGLVASGEGETPSGGEEIGGVTPVDPEGSGTTEPTAPSGGEGGTSSGGTTPSTTPEGGTPSGGTTPSTTPEGGGE